MEKICCDICGYQFKTFERLEEKYHDWESYEEYVTYPDPTDSNPAHLIRNYICDNCYQNIGDVVRTKLIEEGESFVNNLPSRIEEKKKEFELSVKNLESESTEVNSICKKLNNIDHLFELSDDELKLINKYVYSPFRTYYLNDAIKIERERVKNEASIYKWLELFGIEDVKLPNGRSSVDIVSIEEFKNLLKECVLKNYSYEDMNHLLKTIDDYIAKIDN